MTKVKDYYKPNFKKDNWFRYYKEVKDFGVSDYDKNFSKNDFEKDQRDLNTDLMLLTFQNKIL